MTKNPPERQISLESLAEGCAPRIVTLRNCQKRWGGGLSNLMQKKHQQRISAERSFGWSVRVGGRAVRGEVFVCEVWGEVLGDFGLVLLGHSEQINEKLQQKLQPKIPTALHSKTDENSGNDFMMRFCKGTHAPGKRCSASCQTRDWGRDNSFWGPPVIWHCPWWHDCWSWWQRQSYCCLSRSTQSEDDW